MADRPLDPVYLIVWMTESSSKYGDNGKIINKTVYLCVVLKQNGLKKSWHVGWQIGQFFFLDGCTTDLKVRGMQDI